MPMRKRKQKGLQVQISHIYVSFSNDTMALKGLKNKTNKKREEKKKKARPVHATKLELGKKELFTLCSFLRQTCSLNFAAVTHFIFI